MLVRCSQDIMWMPALSNNFVPKEPQSGEINKENEEPMLPSKILRENGTSFARNQ